MALGIPLDQLDKVFLGHLHLDHAGDFPGLLLHGSGEQPAHTGPGLGSLAA